MYAEHNPRIAAHALSSPEGLADVALFTLATIRQPLTIIPVVMQDVYNQGTSSPHLFSFKRQGWEYVEEHMGDLFGQMRIINKYATKRKRAFEALKLFHSIPGLGAVKAGFMAQLCGFEVGCIDSHNLELYGIESKAVEVRKTLKPETIDRKLLEYVELSDKLGGSEHLWNYWCKHVAGTYSGELADDLGTANAVSAWHERCICGDLAPVNPRWMFPEW